MSAAAPAVRDIVLVGGGHSHVQVLKSFGMRPQPGVRLTLVTPSLETPYSGMLPGCISGAYNVDDIHIRLAPLCSFSKARLIHADVAGLDLPGRSLEFADRPSLRYDILSINCGAVPRVPVAGVTTVKPISSFLPKWKALCGQIRSDQRLVVVGAGPGGVELAMAARAALPAGCEIVLLGESLMPGHGARVQALVRMHLQRLQIKWSAFRVSHENEAGVVLSNGEQMSAQHVLWVTQVAAAPWLADSGLSVDDDGFMDVDEHLRSLSHADVFGAGDVANLTGQRRPKSGVYAVRAGPVLAENLRRTVLGKPLRRFRAQKHHLALLSTGDGRAIGSRQGWGLSGKLLWKLKDRIDKKFIAKFNDLPDMPEPELELPQALRADLPEQTMRCGGCGAKLAADPLRRVLARLPDQQSPKVSLGIGDDAAQLYVASGTQLLSVDGFRAMVDDPYVFGRIAAHHALNDILAMAAQPTSALAFISVPLMASELMEEDLFQLMSGVVGVLNAHGVPLVGGHTAEGVELSIGLTVTGEPGTQVLEKSGCMSGDHLLITKPIGTGVALAAAMQGRGTSASLEQALRSMDQSNAGALDVLLAAGARALTDVTGFGLAGHLSEMLRASACGALVRLKDVPVLTDADDLIGDLQSSLQNSNELALNDFELRGPLTPGDPRLRLLADPQTSGGLLASVPEDAVHDTLVRLLGLGYDAADIGEICDTQDWVIE